MRIRRGLRMRFLTYFIRLRCGIAAFFREDPPSRVESEDKIDHRDRCSSSASRPQRRRYCAQGVVRLNPLHGLGFHRVPAIGSEST